MRQAADWTLETAAEHCDLDWRYLQKIEAGSLNFTFVTLVRLSVGFDLPLQELFSPREGAAPIPRRAGRPRKKKVD